MKRCLSFFTVILFSITICCTGCGTILSPVSDTDSSIDSSGNDIVTTLNYYVWIDEVPYATTAADAFNALHNNIKVCIRSLDNTDYEKQLDSMMNDTKTSVDLFGTKGMASTIQFVQKNKALDITDYIRESIKDGSLNVTAYGTMFNSTLYQNRYYCLPSRTTCWELYYNKTVFDRAGIPYPRQMTWDEYCDLAGKLTSGSGKTKVWGGYWVDWIPSFIALQHGSYLTDDDLTYARESLTLFNRLYNIDRSHVSYQEMISFPDPDHEVYRMFKANKVAMVPQGEWMINDLISSNTDVDWDIAPMPIDPDESAGTTVGQYQFVNIASSCAHPAEAFAFMKFLCGKDGAAIYAQNAILPAYFDDNIANEYLKATGKESARIFLEARKYIEQPPVAGYQECLESFKTQAESYFSGQITLDEAMSGFAQTRQAVYDK